MKRAYHILIVDDDADDVSFLTSAFQKLYPQTRFTQVDNGRAALDLLLSITDPADCPDAAFLDLHMPALGGYQVLLELRAVEQCRDFPIMVISTSLLPSEAERCLQAGSTSYFSKPPSLEGYDAIVEATISYLDQKQP